jgi:hypothetical protein
VQFSKMRLPGRAYLFDAGSHETVRKFGIRSQIREGRRACVAGTWERQGNLISVPFSTGM